jgi:hypothetical protein
VFDDLNPRFVRELDNAVKATKKDEVEDEETEVEIEEEQAEEEEPEVDQLDEEDVDDTDEVDEKPTKKDVFDKRLDRSNRLVEETRREAAALRERLTQVEARAQINADDTKYTADKTKLESELVSVRTSLRTAIEAGDTEAQVSAQEKLSDIKGDLKVLEARHVDSKVAVENARAQRTDSPIVKTKAEQWIRKHQRFNTDAEYNATAKSVDSQVKAAGFDPETDDYYKELDKRMSKFYPKEFASAIKKIVPKVRKHPASGIRQNEGGGTKPVTKKSGAFEVRNGRVYLTPRQVQTMRTFQMDPTNPNDVRDFVEQNR